MSDQSSHHETFMREALLLADEAAAMDEVPIGALIVRDDLRLGGGYNCNVNGNDPTAHAEIMALRAAGSYEENYRLSGAHIYVTIEPCPMCFTALVHARIGMLIYGADDPKGGFGQFFTTADLERFNHQFPIIKGVLAEEASAKLSGFFRAKRSRGKRKWLKSPPTH